MPLEVIKNFFSSHFEISDYPIDKVLFAVINIHSSRPPFSPSSFDNADTVYIRKSQSAFFTISAARAFIDGHEVIKCDRSGLTITYSQKEIDIYLGGNDYELELIEVFRDIFFKYLENSGVLVLHASVVAKNGSALLIVGKKGSGKTTTALRLVARKGYELMSGDKAFIYRKDSELVVSGWPDYPHLGWGTLRHLPEFAAHFELPVSASTKTDDDKIPLSPLLFRKYIPHTRCGLALPIVGVLYPQVSGNEQVGLNPISDHRELLVENIETAFGKYSDWNHFQRKESTNLTNIIDSLASKKAWNFVGTAIEKVWASNF